MCLALRLYFGSGLNYFQKPRKIYDETKKLFNYQITLPIIKIKKTTSSKITIFQPQKFHIPSIPHENNMISNQKSFPHLFLNKYNYRNKFLNHVQQRKFALCLVLTARQKKSSFSLNFSYLLAGRCFEEERTHCWI